MGSVRCLVTGLTFFADNLPVVGVALDEVVGVAPDEVSPDEVVGVAPDEVSPDEVVGVAPDEVVGVALDEVGLALDEVVGVAPDELALDADLIGVALGPLLPFARGVLGTHDFGSESGPSTQWRGDK